MGPQDGIDEAVHPVPVWAGAASEFPCGLGIPVALVTSEAAKGRLQRNRRPVRDRLAEHATIT